MQIKLGVLVLRDGKAATIFNSLKDLLDKFEAWENITIIIADTTSVNTGKRNKVVTKLQ